MKENASPLAGIIAQIQHGRMANSKAVQLMAVSKKQSADAVRALVRQGQYLFGENYVQEAVEKQKQLSDLADVMVWALIGPLQRNKTQLAAQHFDWVCSVDRVLIAQRLSAARVQSGKSVLNICLQVNIDGQASKSGCAPSDVFELIAAIEPLPHLCLRGLMVIPAPESVYAFEDAARLFASVAVQFPQLTAWDVLSMGMSADFEQAIAAGSTMVRIGTALFGERH